MDQLKASSKPFDISKWEVWEAWLKVKGNQGAPGVDGQSVEDFEKDLKNNLYKIWNRMSSGTYFPPPVLAVEIPKAHGAPGVRVLGVPTVADRVAQTVVAAYLERRVDRLFHPDSYGYRPGRSALDAVGRCRERCWQYDWVIDLDIRKFFDSVPWDLVLKAVRAHTDARWVLLYVERWLAAPLRQPDGSLLTHDRGTAQGSSVSPILANLFMHCAFDLWLSREFPQVAFERYADDAVIHCTTRFQAEKVLAAVRERMAQVGLELHADKTKIVYCRDSRRRGAFPCVSFTFLGFTFQPRSARRRKDGKMFTGFLPAVSRDALKKMSAAVRSWRIHRWVNASEEELAAFMNAKVRGWMNYYGAFGRGAMSPLLYRVETCLLRWVRKKYKKLANWGRAIAYLRDLKSREPRYFAHWAWSTPVATRPG